MLAATNPINTLNLNELIMVKFWSLSLDKLFKTFQQQERKKKFWCVGYLSKFISLDLILFGLKKSVFAEVIFQFTDKKNPVCLSAAVLVWLTFCCEI